jgi:hypothetical protein
MILRKKYAKHICREDISLVENYDKAIADTTQTWILHHRDEIRELPSGMIARRSAEELMENGRYYDCPANELIFLTPAEHTSLHHKGKVFSEETLKKMSNSLKGRVSARKGVTLTNETKEKLAQYNLTDFGKAFVEHYHKMPYECKHFYNIERKFYKRHGYFRYNEVQDV